MILETLQHWFVQKLDLLKVIKGAILKFKTDVFLDFLVINLSPNCSQWTISQGLVEPRSSQLWLCTIVIQSEVEKVCVCFVWIISKLNQTKMQYKNLCILSIHLHRVGGGDVLQLEHDDLADIWQLFLIHILVGEKNQHGKWRTLLSLGSHCWRALGQGT